MHITTNTTTEIYTEPKTLTITASGFIRTNTVTSGNRIALRYPLMPIGRPIATDIGDGFRPLGGRG